MIMENSHITNRLFREAVEAIDAGNLVELKRLLEANPELVSKPLDTPDEEGYFKNPYLLWFVADNPIRHEKLPLNIVEVAEVILAALRASADPEYSFIV